MIAVRIHTETLGELPRRFGLPCAECFPMLLQLNFVPPRLPDERICSERDARVIHYEWIHRLPLPFILLTRSSRNVKLNPRTRRIY